jgi:DNA-binding IclR family transcriptional regulator
METSTANERSPASELGSAPLRRAAAVLDAVVASKRGLSLQMIADTLSLPPSTAHRLLQSLVAINYLDYDREGRLYVIGPRIHRLMVMSIGSATVASLAEPVLRPLANRFQQIAYLTGLAGDELELKAHVLPNSASSSLVYPGNVFPIHATATGKAIFAFQSEQMIESKLAAPLTKYQERTIIDVAELRAELARVRKAGFAVIDSELDKGVFAVACPVVIQKAGVLYAIALVGLKEKMFQDHDLNEFVAALSEAAQNFSMLLQHARVDRT